MAGENYWDNKTERSKRARLHTTEMESRYPDEISECVKSVSVYTGNRENGIQKYRENSAALKITVTPLDTVSAAFEYGTGYGKTVILNFASYRNAGGMFIKGSRAQEECLCHESFLYNVLRKCDFYYDWNEQHKNRNLYLDRALYARDVVFEHDGRIQKFDVLTCAAPNYTAFNKYSHGSMAENLKALDSRMIFARNIIEKNGCDCAILGAFGCGVFGQPPKEVAENWKKCFTETGLSHIVYAVLGETTENYKTFTEILG